MPLKLWYIVCIMILFASLWISGMLLKTYDKRATEGERMIGAGDKVIQSMKLFSNEIPLTQFIQLVV